MNADDRNPAGEAKPPFRPVTGEPPVRREGLMPPSGSVPQRTAFRSVTGTTPTSPHAGAPAQAPPPSAGPRPSTYAPPSTQGAPQLAPQSAPRVPMPETVRPASSTAPGAFAPARPGVPTTGAPMTGAPTTGAPIRTGAPATGFPATGAPATGAPATGFRVTGAPTTGAPTTGVQMPRADEVGAPAGTVAGSFGIGRLKGVASERLKASDPKAPIPGAPRKVRVLLSRIDPWSALKIGFLASIAIGIMTVVAVWVLWEALNQMETFVTIQQWVSKLFTQGQEVNILQFFDLTKVMSATVLIAVVNVVLISGLSVIAAFIYNMISSVVGGVYLTLTDD
jgi:hypothetical protein